MALNYRKVERNTEQGAYLSLAVPYGGHLANTSLRPPLYEICPDVLVTSESFQQLFLVVHKFLKQGRTVYCHPVVKEGFWDWNLAEMKDVMFDILNSKKYERGNLVILPANASLFKVVHKDESGVENVHYTPFFDYGDSLKTNLKEEINKELLRVLKDLGREEKMIWTTKELPGSWISTLWSKRVITPKMAFEV